MLQQIKPWRPTAGAEDRLRPQKKNAKNKKNKKKKKKKTKKNKNKRKKTKKNKCVRVEAAVKRVLREAICRPLMVSLMIGPYRPSGVHRHRRNGSSWASFKRNRRLKLTRAHLTS